MPDSEAENRVEDVEDASAEEHEREVAEENVENIEHVESVGVTLERPSGDAIAEKQNAKDKEAGRPDF